MLKLSPVFEAADGGHRGGADTLDLDACGREPIHIPGSIQPHGHLLVFDSAGKTLLHASSGAESILNGPVADRIGRPMAEVLALEPMAMLRDGLRDLPDLGPKQLGACQLPAGKQSFQAIAHRSPDGFAILEFEPLPPPEDEWGIAVTLEGLYPLIREAFASLGNAADLQDIVTIAAREVQRITGFDRVLVYRFEKNWDGVVVAEENTGALPVYLGLRFPASDIPPQARRLYTENRLRLIADVDYVPVPIVPGHDAITGAPIDLSHAALRSVSPVHLQYMRNMGTPASMSVSVLRGETLWGLISCHHSTPKRVPFAVRAACDLIGQLLSVRIAAKEDAALIEERSRLKTIEGRLLAHMAAAQDRYADGLTSAPHDLCALANAAGAAVLAQGTCTLIGRTPPEAEIRRMAEWLHEQRVDDVWSTNALAQDMPGGESYLDSAAGVLAVSISRLHPSYLFWFRPELVRSVTWGGNPDKRVDESGPADRPLNPRRSFEAWKQLVRGTAEPWTPAQIEAARDLRTAILSVVLRLAEERAELTGRLERTNAELAAFSYSVSHDLRAPFRHIVGYAELLLERETKRLDEKSQRYIATIIEAAETAGLLVDALLNFSRMGRASLTPVLVDTAGLVQEAIRSLAPDIRDRDIVWTIGALPEVCADPTMLRQVFLNLISNAAKYSRDRRPSRIDILCDSAEECYIFCVRDNGVGFDMAYAHKLFGVFQRLHRSEDFEGVGIGLANVRRIVERHGGRSWAEGTLDQGAAFYFTLPRTAVRPERD